MKKYFKHLYSMKLAMVILVVLAIVCSLISVIPQNEIEAFYFENYSEWMAQIILFTQLDNAFFSWWFIFLAAMLCMSLTLCSIIRLPLVIKKYQTIFNQDSLEKGKEHYYVGEINEEPDTIFKALHFKDTKNSVCLYRVKNKMSVFGSWLCHLAMLMIMIGYGAGQILSTSTVVYGVENTSHPVDGTPYFIDIHQFDAILRTDFTVEQYVSEITFRTEDESQSETGITKVNHPFEAFGYKVYQNGTGWANRVSIYHKDELIVEDYVVHVGEAFKIPETQITMVLSQFYPDYAEKDHKPYSKSPFLLNPTSLFGLYFQGELVDMNVVSMGDPIIVSDYTVIFSSPQEYTLFEVVSDSTMVFVAIGGGLLLVSLFLSFYLNAKECLLVKAESGLKVYVRSLKGQALYMDDVHDKLSVYPSFKGNKEENS